MTNQISLQEAETLTHAFQNSIEFQGQTIAGEINKAEIVNLINQTDCINIRIYNAINSNNQLTFVIVGVNAAGEDMTGGIILDRLALCPPNCHNSSPLMLTNGENY